MIDQDEHGIWADSECDEAFPSASIVAGCFIAAMLLIAVAVVGASL